MDWKQSRDLGGNRSHLSQFQSETAPDIMIIQPMLYFQLEIFAFANSPVSDVHLLATVIEHLRGNQNDHPGQKFVRLISDSFEVTGPHGIHTCLLYPPAGLDMRDCMQCLPGGTLAVPLVRAVVRNILLALNYLHQANIIHTGTFGDSLIHVTLIANIVLDIQPNNILAGVEDESLLSTLEQSELSSPSPGN